MHDYLEKFFAARPYAPARVIKQRATNDDIKRLWDNAQKIVPKSWLDELVALTANRIRAATIEQDLTPLVAWSSGKDSIALNVCARAAGAHSGVMSIAAREVEYPAILRWVDETENKPRALRVFENKKINLDYIYDDPRRCFPRSADDITRFWGNKINRGGVKRFYDEQGFSVILLGRRLSDGNAGARIYTDKKGRRFSNPIWEWSHEEVMAACQHYETDMPPWYDWPDGFIRGTHPWPQRKSYCADRSDCLKAIKKIDKKLHWRAKKTLDDLRVLYPNHDTFL